MGMCSGCNSKRRDAEKRAVLERELAVEEVVEAARAWAGADGVDDTESEALLNAVVKLEAL